jgi:hypothetical protein
VKNKVLAVLGLVLPASAVGQTGTVDARMSRMTVGEVLEFEARIGPLRVGIATMEVIGLDTVRGEPTMQFKFRMRANAAGIFRMNNQFDSWVGMKDFASRRFVQDWDETGQKKINRYEIYPDSGYYTRPDVDTALTTSADALDDTAFFYFVRTLDLTPGDSLTFNNYFRPDRNPVVIHALEYETIEVPAGEFETLLVHPVIKGGGFFKQSSNARMWISNDEHRVIVQMKMKVSAITITMRLRRIHGPNTLETGAGN